MSSPGPVSREFRVFLSSTFRDMDQERDYLLTHIFPVFRAACLDRLVSFTEIDLRWGVTEEDAKNGRTVEICLDEIERCRKIQPPPFFIGFLGERYGWIPTHADLEQYWETHSDSPYAARIQKALDEGISVTELEMRVAFMDPGVAEGTSRGRFYLRAPDLTRSIAAAAGKGKDDLEFYDPAGDHLTLLKDTLRATPFIGLDGYHSISQFGDAVMDFLMEQLDRYFPANVAPAPEALMTASHARYAQSRLHAYVPLPEVEQSVLDAWHAARTQLNAAPIVISAPSGRGKSAFLAHLASRFTAQDDAKVFAHYIGADGFLTLSAWHDRLIAFLQGTGHLVSPVPTTDDERWDNLPILLSEAVRGLGKPLVLLLDALNQLTGAAESIARLSALRLPQDVVLIATATPEVLVPKAELIELPALDIALREQAIAAFLEIYRKKLPPELIPLLASTPACATPLYLRLVLEELRLHARFETLAAKATDLLTFTDAGTLFAHVLSVMDTEDFRDPLHPMLASRAARFMAVSRRGLQHHELAELLAGSSDLYISGTGHSRLPDFILAPLLSRLALYCLNDDGRMALMHAILREALLNPAESAETARRDMIAYVSPRADIPALAEHIFQLQALQDSEGLVAKLGVISTIASLTQSEPLLLRDALIWLGAGLAVPTPAIAALSELWKANFASAEILPENTSSVTRRFIDLSFLTIGVSWVENIVDWKAAHHQKSPSDINNLARLYQDQGRLNEAEPLLLEALKIRRQAQPAGHPDIASSLNNLATLYLNQGRLSDAEPLFLEALQIYRQALPAGHPNIAMSLSSLATLYQAQGRLSEAEPLFLEALQIYRQALPAEHPNIAISLNSLATLYQAQGRLSEAEPLFLEALQIYRQALPAGHPDIALSLNNLASLYQAQGRLNEAEPLFLEALQTLRQALAPRHPNIAISLSNLAGLYQAQGRLSEAEPLFLEALQIYCQALPPGHPTMATPLNNLAGVYQARGQLNEAEPLYLEALKIRRQSLPAGHPDIATTLNNLAGVYQTQRQLNEAEPLYLEALKIRRQALPAGHPDIATTLSNLAGLYQNQGRLSEAEALRLEALPVDDSKTYE
ncbi:tetratricopeptide repeat protein [Gluconobacter sp. Dm-44]|uniref:tetratricopeptide repeat protein n=1 Tax=Gluconobacter sp. Dm-44 TaxID=2799805 RepID=UPI001B8C9E26|nr:tetratricopeptide repeat protein [Gluconobacter sp. Dm-44]MBS1059422.1 tetratricopeptide repeat protein [Gluconobacter sp. Dm-44]